MNLLSKLLLTNNPTPTATFTAADMLAQASLTNTPTPGNPKGNKNQSSTGPSGLPKITSAQEREKIATHLNLSPNNIKQIQNYRIDRRKTVAQLKQNEIDNSIARKKKIKPPVIPESLKKTLKRDKNTENNSETSPLI